MGGGGWASRARRQEDDTGGCGWGAGAEEGLPSHTQSQVCPGEMFSADTPGSCRKWAQSGDWLQCFPLVCDSRCVRRIFLPGKGQREGWGEGEKEVLTSVMEGNYCWKKKIFSFIHSLSHLGAPMSAERCTGWTSTKTDLAQQMTRVLSSDPCLAPTPPGPSGLPISTPHQPHACPKGRVEFYLLLFPSRPLSSDCQERGQFGWWFPGVGTCPSGQE